MLTGCEGSVPSDVIRSEVEIRFPAAHSIEIDRSDCDSGGTPVVRFLLSGGIPEAKAAFSGDLGCSAADSGDPLELMWRCRSSHGFIYYSYGESGSAMAG